MSCSDFNAAALALSCLPRPTAVPISPVTRKTAKTVKAFAALCAALDTYLESSPGLYSPPARSPIAPLINTDCTQSQGEVRVPSFFAFTLTNVVRQTEV